MGRRWIAAAVVAGMVGTGSAVWAQSGRPSSREGPRPRAAPGTRMGPEMGEGMFNADEALRHMGDMMRHLAGMLDRLGKAAMDGKLPPGERHRETSALLKQMAAMTQQMARVMDEGRMSRKMMGEMGDQMAAMQAAMKRIPTLAQAPAR